MFRRSRGVVGLARYGRAVIGVLVAGVLSFTAVKAAQAVPLPYEFLSGPEGFDGTLTGGAPLISPGAFSLPFFDAVDPGPPDTQAGSHPYQLTIGFASNDTPGKLILFPTGMTAKFYKTEEPLIEEDGFPTSDLKDATVNLPRGMIVNPEATPVKCTATQVEQASLEVERVGGGCPYASQVGVVTLYVGRPEELTVTRSPLYDMVAPPGVPAQLAFNDQGAGLTVFFNGRLRSGGDYGLSAEARSTLSKLPILGATTTLWGDPSSPSHDGERGYCSGLKGHLEVEEGKFNCPVVRTFTPMLTLPSACSGPLSTSIEADSWQQPGAFAKDSFVTHDQERHPVGVEGCGAVPFAPTIEVKPETSASASPTGLHVDLHVPQNEELEGLATANLKNAIVTLPEGMVVNPSSATGLQGCSPAQIELHGREPAHCPDASKIGKVEVDTPLLDHPLPGAVYLAAQDDNPFHSLLAIYIAVDDPATGVVVKLAGHVEADPVTGRLTTTFLNNPELPFEDFKLDFFGGSRAPLITPSVCGAYTTTSDLVPWSAPQAPDANPTSSFTIGEGCADGFAPSFSAGTSNNQAGAYSPFSVTFSRQGNEQSFGGVSVTTPPGLLGVLKNVVQCPEPQAGKGECGPESELGETTVAVGAGPNPYWVKGGRVYLTGPYNGGPFGLSIVVPTVAGPFTLTGNGGPGKEIVRASIRVDSHTAQITVLSDPLPRILEGIPLDVRTVNVTVNRPGFMFNPTNCSPLSVTGTLTSAQNTSAGVSSPFEAANCATLPFKPSFVVSTAAKTSKANGASLTVKVGSSTGQANIAKVRVTLPKQLPARLTTLQKACTEAQFDTNPAGCPAASAVGTATAITPLLAHPLTGPAYLVSHGGAAFPDLVFILQGEGILLYLDGNTNIKKGITTSTFNSVPDAPIGTFETAFPEGPHSVLATNIPTKAKGNMCGQKLTMPTTITGQNGAVTTQTTHIAVSGCPKIKKVKKKAKAKGHGNKGKTKGKK